MAVQTQIQARRGTAATWTSTNPTLAAGEIGFETDTGKFKIGNGSTAWAALAYNTNGAAASPLTTKGDLYTYSTGNTRLAVGANGETIVADSSTATGLRWQAPVNSNPVLNSAFQNWQRGTSIAVNASTYTYTADRWQLDSGNTCTVSQQATADTTNLPNIQWAARVQRNSGQTSTTNIHFHQPFETVNSRPFSGKTVTLSFYARSGANFSAASSLLRVQLITGTGTDQNPRSGSYTGQALPIDTDVTLTTTWQRFTLTGNIAATATEIDTLFRYTPSGTAGANDYYEITGVQLEVGSVATPFKTYAGTIQGELDACQRYYLRDVGGATYSSYANGSGVVSTTEAYFDYKFKVTMRTTPSALEVSNVSVGDLNAGTFASTTITIAFGGVNSVNLKATTTGLTQYRPYQLLNTNNTAGYLGFSAEL